LVYILSNRLFRRRFIEDVIGKAKAILNGMAANEADMKAIGLDPALLAALVDKFILQDGR
jgi:hypothetical protein